MPDYFTRQWGTHSGQERVNITLILDSFVESNGTQLVGKYHSAWELTSTVPEVMCSVAEFFLSSRWFNFLAMFLHRQLLCLLPVRILSLLVDMSCFELPPPNQGKWQRSLFQVGKAALC